MPTAETLPPPRRPPPAALPAPPPGPIGGAPSAEEMAEREAKRAALRRMKRIATGSLVVAAVGYVLLHVFGRGPVAAFFEAVFEASVVGGIADWFAVTALFRHPLGLPIPHTNIIVKNQARIGRSLGQFVRRSFLRPDDIRRVVTDRNAAGIAAEWLAAPENAARVTRAATPLALRALEKLDGERVREMMGEHVVDRLREADAAGALSDLFARLAEKGIHEEVLDAGLTQLADLMRRHEDDLRAVVREAVPRYVPGVVADLVHAQISARVAETIVAMLTHPDHDLRGRIHAGVGGFVERLRDEPETRERVNALWQRTAGGPVLTERAGALWEGLRARLVADLESPDSELRGRVEAWAREAGERTLADERVQANVNRMLADVVGALAEPLGGRAADFMAEKVGTWAPDEVVDRIETSVGRDLQYIRLNGTAVGGLVGGVLHLVTTWLG